MTEAELINDKNLTGEYIIVSDILDSLHIDRGREGLSLSMRGIPDS